jgi:hypothetical protein
MSFLGGILKSVINPATLMQLAMGPAGWASLAARTIGMAIAQQVIQQLGQQLGLPPAVINMAQQAFSAAAGQPGSGIQSIASAVGQAAQQLNLSPREQGQLQRTADETFREMLANMSETSEMRDLKASPKAGGSFLQKLAIALGKIMDEKMNKMVELSEQISQQTSIAQGKGTGADNAKTKLGELNGQLAAVGQELNIISNALNTAVKSIGESQTTIARKS